MNILIKINILDMNNVKNRSFWIVVTLFIEVF